jgi:hypothetical protein
MFILPNFLPFGLKVNNCKNNSPSDVKRHISSLVARQTETRNSLIHQQQSIAVFEKVVVQHLKIALMSYLGWKTRDHHNQSEILKQLSSKLDILEPEKDWELLKARKPDLIIEADAPLVKREDIVYEGMDDLQCELIKEGTLQKRAMGMLLRGNNYKPGHYVLTMSGYLHAFPPITSVSESTGLLVNLATESNASERPELGEPEMSFYLPECTIGGKGSDPKQPDEFYIQDKSGFLGRTEKHRVSSHTGR